MTKDDGVSIFDLRKTTYETRYDVRFIPNQLGGGKDGTVLLDCTANAVKFLRDVGNYNRELRAYRRLGHEEIHEVRGHQIPKLQRFDDELLTIEMTSVVKPFLLDFASTYTDDELEWLGFDEQILEEREAHWVEIFESRWPHVVAIRTEFYHMTGLHLLDLSLNNIGFA